MLTKAATIAAAVPLLIVVLIAAAAAAILGSTKPMIAAQPSSAATADIPADYLRLYQQAAAVCPGLDWTILAAIGKIESDHGRSTLPGVAVGENRSGAGVISRSFSL